MESTSLLVYDDVEELLRYLLKDFDNGPAEPVVVVTRKNKWVTQLQGQVRPEEASYRSLTIERFRAAVLRLRAGESAEALAYAESGISRILFGYDSPSDDDIGALGVEIEQWREFLVTHLLDAEAGAYGCSVYEWGSKLKGSLKTSLQDRGWWDQATSQGSLRRPARTATQDLVWEGVASHSPEESAELLIKTVHGVKGETHHTTVLFVPPVNGSECPSEAWWNEDEPEREERRVAFVAATRPRYRFALAVHRATYLRLRELRPDFAALFKVTDIAQSDD